MGRENAGGPQRLGTSISLGVGEGGREGNLAQAGEVGSEMGAGVEVQEGKE